MKISPVCLLSLMFLSSCGGDEDSELMKRYEEQQVVLKELQDELSRTRREIDKSKIEDPAPDFRKMEAEIKKVKEEKEVLVDKIAALKANKEAKMKEFEDYKKNYPVRSK